MLAAYFEEEWSIVSWTIMLTVYSQHGSCRRLDEMPQRAELGGGRIRPAQELFHAIPELDLVSFTTMLVRLSLGREELLQEAENLFQGMKQRGLGSSFCEDDLSMVEERFWIKKFRTAQELIW
ncbi:uncharacterized protein LOC112342002 [Selaginella moellendorffii]|uniref:uncharacterized protein LOC112342002 n=1 Tax=Selaginella moellendorffii TaxID=88036 RepID=UPI000D1CF8F7|nr:uncharacterized protein LOC112342002 [Selaginella moellendorffii]|eukprot:XP_024518851.1 uncharacterized protein LOC112342002 [Selaginella moellendorffii]